MKTNIKEEELVNLPHGFVGAFNGHHWEIWESKEDYYQFYPYEGEIRGGKPMRILTEKEARAFANKCYKSIRKKEMEK